MTGVTAFDTLLRRGRAGLNRILLATWLAGGTAVTGLIAGLVILAGRWLAWPWAALSTWAAITAIGGTAGLAAGWMRRLDRTAAAWWLDRHLDTREMFSAALFCLDRRLAGKFDVAVVNQAESVAGGPFQIRWPLRRLTRLAAAAVVSALVMGLLIGMAKPIGVVPAGKAPTRVVPGRWGERTVEERQSRLARIFPGQVAQAVFPKNTWLANRLEQALRSGDFEAVKHLLAQAQREMDAELDGATTEQRRRLEAEQERRRQAMQQIMPQRPDGEEGRRGGTGQPDQGEEEAGGSGTQDAGQEGSRQSRGKTGQDSQAYSGKPREDWEEEEAGDSTYPRGGKGSGQPGRGTGGQGSGRPVQPRAGGEKAVISQNKDGLIEYILPGGEISVPLSQAAADSSRAAEGAFAHEGLPGEYADFVRAYFLQLAGEAASASAEGGQKK